MTEEPALGTLPHGCCSRGLGGETRGCCYTDHTPEPPVGGAANRVFPGKVRRLLPREQVVPEQTPPLRGTGASGAWGVGRTPPRVFLSGLSLLSIRVEDTCFSKSKPLENHGF